MQQDCFTYSVSTSRLILPLLAAVVLALVACDETGGKAQAERAIAVDNPAPNPPQKFSKVEQTKQSQINPPTNVVPIAPGNIVVLALSVHDERAVVKSAQGEMVVLKPGDSAPGTRAKLVEILGDRLVFEDLVTRPSGVKAKQMVWVYKANKSGVSMVKVLAQNAPKMKTFKLRSNNVVGEHSVNAVISNVGK